jgi:hypothetical protein
MAELTVDNNDIVLRLSVLESLAAWRREVRVPVHALRMVQVDDAPLARLARWRLPGVWWPGSLALGTSRRCGRREFAAVRAQPALVLDFEGAHWDRLVASHPDAVRMAADLAGLVLERGPGSGPGGRRGGPGANGPSGLRRRALQRGKRGQLRPPIEPVLVAVLSRPSSRTTGPARASGTRGA